MNTLGVTVVGAHPDDVEIAAGGTVAMLCDAEVDLLAVVVTDEDDATVARTRRAEALAGLGELGLRPDAVEFLGLRDRHVVADSVAISTLRRTLVSRGRTGDVIITHSVHDHHPDHRAVNEIVGSALTPEGAVLGMAVVNSMLARFEPSIAVDVTDRWAAKLAALDRHRSQDVVGRIRRPELADLAARFGALIGAPRAEAFELVAPGDGRAVRELAGMVGALPVGDHTSLTDEDEV